MPLSVQFRWKSPTLQAPKSQAEMDNLNQNLTQLGNSILAAKKSRREQEQLERKNKIEDEDRQRKQDEEDAKTKANLEVADMINKKLGERQALQAQREQIASRLETLKAQLAQLGG